VTYDQMMAVASELNTRYSGTLVCAKGIHVR
jgi:hypothetical protein